MRAGAVHGADIYSTFWKRFMKAASGASGPAYVKCVREHRSKIGMQRKGIRNKHDSIKSATTRGFLKPAPVPRPCRGTTVRENLPGQCGAASCRLGSGTNGLVSCSHVSASETNCLEPIERAHETVLGFEAPGKRSADRTRPRG